MLCAKNILMANFVDYAKKLGRFLWTLNKFDTCSGVLQNICPRAPSSHVTPLFFNIALFYITTNPTYRRNIKYHHPNCPPRCCCPYVKDPLDRCHTCDFIARFCRATLLRDKIANVTCHVAHCHIVA